MTAETSGPDCRICWRDGHDDAVHDGMLVRTIDLAGEIRIHRADPRLLLSFDQVDEIRDGNSPYERASRLNGDIWTIRAMNRIVIYRLASLPGWDGYLAEWPD